MPQFRCSAVALALVLCLGAAPRALAQDQSGPQGTSRGENFSANKSPAQLFASDCTGSGCHKSPQGLGKSAGIGGLAGFLREHYTNSRESAAALANYLSKIPSGPEPREARTPRPGSKPATASAPASSSPSWFDGGIGETKPPAAGEARPARQTPAGQNATAPATPTRASRAGSKPDDEPPTSANPSSSTAEPTDASPKPADQAAKPADGAKPAESAAKPGEVKPTSPARAQRERGRQPATATAAAPATPHVPEAAPASAPPPAAAPAPPKQFDIFD